MTVKKVKRPNLSEIQIQGQILMFLKSKRIKAWRNQSVGIFDPTRKIFRKNHSAHHLNGVSDILGVLPDGRFLAIEVKSKTGKPTPAQIHFIADVNANNGVGFFANSVDTVALELFEDWEII